MKSKSILLALTAVLCGAAWAQEHDFSKPATGSVLFHIGSTLVVNAPSEQQATGKFVKGQFEGVLVVKDQKGICYLQHYKLGPPPVFRSYAASQSSIPCDSFESPLAFLQTSAADQVGNTESAQ